MTPTRDEQATVATLLAPVCRWLDAGGDAWQMDLDYWDRRRRIVDAGEFPSLGADALSDIDGAMDVFSPDPDRDPNQIDEARLTVELEEAFARLRAVGYEL